MLLKFPSYFYIFCIKTKSNFFNILVPFVHDQMNICNKILSFQCIAPVFVKSLSTFGTSSQTTPLYFSSRCTFFLSIYSTHTSHTYTLLLSTNWMNISFEPNWKTLLFYHASTFIERNENRILFTRKILGHSNHCTHKVPLRILTETL